MQLPPDLDRDVEKLVGMVWSLKILFGCGDLLIVKELHRYFILLLRLWNGCDLFDPFGDFPRNQQRQDDSGRSGGVPSTLSRG
jgi:hypothetical protein